MNGFETKDWYFFLLRNIFPNKWLNMFQEEIDYLQVFLIELLSKTH